MLGFDAQYDPIDTETFLFFGKPQLVVHRSPERQFFKDIGNILIKFRLIHLVLWSFYTTQSIDELYLWATPVFSLAWFTFWSAVQIPIVFTILFCFMFVAVMLGTVTTIHDVLVWRIMQGPPIQVYPPKLPHGCNRRHRWVYINGIATGKTITRQNLMCLSEKFHNPILAINNRTFGFMGDVFECIVQRAFGYRNTETFQATDVIRSYLRDHINIDKVILIAHSQGGIIASQILDDLYCDLSPDELQKLEVYTFGSAALRFRNPFKDKTHTERMIPVVEHYCNESDMVTSWGALASKADRDGSSFIGKVFIFEGQTGHMLNQHYLRHMFTGPPDKWEPDNFQLRFAEEDPEIKDKYHVKRKQANIATGKASVQSLSHLWTYL